MKFAQRNGLFCLVVSTVSMLASLSYAVSVDDELQRRYSLDAQMSGLYDYGPETLSGELDRVRAESLARNQRLDQLKQRIEQLNASVRTELQSEDLRSMGRQCREFVNETRFQAAPFYQRLKDIAKSQMKVEEQLLVVDPKIRGVLKSWIDFANNPLVTRSQFTLAFTNSDCRPRQDGSQMTDRMISATLKMFERNVKILELL